MHAKRTAFSLVCALLLIGTWFALRSRTPPILDTESRGGTSSDGELAGRHPPPPLASPGRLDRTARPPDGGGATEGTSPSEPVAGMGDSTGGQPPDSTGARSDASGNGSVEMTESARKALAGWAEPASAFRVFADARARGLPRRIRRAADGAYMVLLPAGEFTMGGGLAQASLKVDADAVPDVRVSLTRAFYMDEVEVTNSQWAKYRATVPVVGTTTNVQGLEPDAPVVGVTFEDATQFAQWAQVKLPTEAQWERAARGYNATTLVVYPHGFEPETDSTHPERLGTRHWTGDRAGGPTLVGSFAPNDCGLFDLAGNASELCRDVYRSDYYRRSLGVPRVDSLCDDEGASPAAHVVRGGSWFGPRTDMRVFTRCDTSRADPRGIGFRCVRELEWDLCLPVIPTAEERPRRRSQ